MNNLKELNNVKEVLNKLIGEPNELGKFIKLEELRYAFATTWCIEHPNVEDRMQVYRDFGYLLYQICIDKIPFDKLRDKSSKEYLDWLLMKNKIIYLPILITDNS